MRYFLLGWVILCMLVVAIAGKRGDISRKPPIEVFPDMDRQYKLRPQTRANFFEDKMSSRLPVPGTIARGVKFEDVPANTGLVPGTTNYVATIPVELTQTMMLRGQERYGISCAPCHGPIGDGKGITSRFGMAIVRNLHDPIVVRIGDGEMFNVITHGRGLMGSYGAQIATEDRWAIVAYVRALQRSRIATMEDVPADQRASVK